ncbi:MAG: FecR domain-containing protein [Deltaproteobacteria bacterium]|nr:FecR domain-containing protein [Deltaproteobacteria bacterium]
MTSWFQGKHLPEASLHAYVAGEVDPPSQAAIRAHLSACDVCQERLGRVRVVQGLFRGMVPKEPDELAWRRIRERVRTTLENDAAPEAVHTIDLLMGRRWVPAGLAAAVAIAVVVLLLPGKQRPAPAPEVRVAEIAPAPSQAQAIASGPAPLELTLASGANLKLKEQTKVVAEAPGGPAVSLTLERGALDVSLPRRPEGGESFEIHTPGFVANARSANFSVGYQADEFSVEVRDGEVDVEGPVIGPKKTLVEGERLAGSTRPRAPASAPTAKSKARPAPRPVSDPVVVRPAEPAGPIVSSSEGETTVEVLELPLDEVAAAWREASDAYYQRKDLDQAIAKAQEVQKAKGRPEARLAQQLLCDAYIAKAEPHEAVDACRALLDAAGPDEARAIHYTLATIHRAQLQDCRQAIQHYNQAVVFGRATLLDDEVRLFRAGCAIEVGDLDLAWRDVMTLNGRAGRLARPAELEALKQRLNEISGGRPRSNGHGRPGE